MAMMLALRVGAACSADPIGAAEGHAGHGAATLVAQILMMDTSNSVVQAKEVKVKISDVNPERLTDQQGRLRVTMSSGQHTLNTVSGKRCYFDFSVEAGKTLDLVLLVPGVDDKPCVKMPAPDAAAAASAAASK